MGFTQTTVRTDDDDLALASRLVEPLAKQEYVREIGSVTRATVLRIALRRGLQTLHAELMNIPEPTPVELAVPGDGS